jgi:hypothetical protein
LRVGALASAVTLLIPTNASEQTGPKPIAIRTLTADSLKTRLATRGSLSGLRMLQAATEVTQTRGESVANATLLTLTVD